MVCEEIRELLSEYLDEVLPGLDRDAVEAHLSSCGACRKELESLRSVLQGLHSLEPVEPPQDFLGQLHERMAQRPWFVRILRRLFIPMRVKIPLQLAGALAVAVLVFSILLVQQSEYWFPAYRLKSAARVSTEQAREVAPEGETESRPSKTDSAQAPLMAVKPGPDDEQAAETPAPLAARRTAPAAMKMKDAELQSLPETKAALRTGSAAGKELEEDKASMDLVLRMWKKKGEMAFSSAVTGPMLEAQPAAEARAAKSMALKTREGEGADPAFRQVKHLIEDAQGKVLSADYDKDTGELESVHAEIPASQYSTLYDGLSTLGDVQAPAKALPKEDRAPVELRIKMKAPR